MRYRFILSNIYVVSESIQFSVGQPLASFMKIYLVLLYISENAERKYVFFI